MERGRFLAYLGPTPTRTAVPVPRLTPGFLLFHTPRERPPEAMEPPPTRHGNRAIVMARTQESTEIQAPTENPAPKATTRGFGSEVERVAAIGAWLHGYNRHRGHTSPKGQPPASRSQQRHRQVLCRGLALPP